MKITRLIPSLLLMAAPLWADIVLDEDFLCSEPTDEAIIRYAEQNGASPAELRVLKESVLPLSECGLEFGDGIRRFIGCVETHQNDKGQWLVRVSPPVSGKGYGYWTVVADAEGNTLCRIDHHICQEILGVELDATHADGVKIIMRSFYAARKTATGTRLVNPPYEEESEEDFYEEEEDGD